MRQAAILIVCFLSGFSALVCEMVWSRMLVPVFGNTIHAAGMVTGIFMAGLALGGSLGGRRTAGLSRKHLITGYAVLEAGIGLSALFFPFMKQALLPLYLHLAAMLDAAPCLMILLRMAYCSALLLPPALFMGAAFPFIGALFIEDHRRTGRGAALVYGFNTLGGTAGVLAAGFFLIRELGSRASLAAAGGISLCVSLAVLLAAFCTLKRNSERLSAAPLPETMESRVLHNEADASSARWVTAGAGIAGFCALAYEMVWTRLLVLVMQNSVYAFSLILAGFLAGIGLGGLLAAPLLRSGRRPLTLFAGVQVLCGIVCLLTPFGFSLPERPGELTYLSFLLTRPFFMVLAPMLFSGALVPLAVAAVHRPGQAAGHTLGRIYAANSLGSVAGALLGGFALVPLLGCRRTGLLLFGLQVLSGFFLLAGDSDRKRFRFCVSAAGIGLVILGAALVPEDLIQQRYTAAAAGEQPVYFNEGRSATASVTRNRAGNLILYLNGIPEVTNDRPAMRTFRLMALLPCLMNPGSENALMITFGAGISAGLAVHLFPEVTCVELNEDCREIARIFKTENRNVLKAANLTLQIDDGRNFLLHSAKKYGAVISDATHPHSYDSWILFTREFYRLCAQRLDSGGVFCQWLPLHGLAPRQFRTVLNTLRSVFPEYSLWIVDGAYCLMLAGNQPLQPDPKRLTEILNRNDLRPFFDPLGLNNPYAVLNCFAAGRAGLDALLENETRINTDDQPFNQFFPLAVTGYGRLRWHIENLRQLAQCRHKNNSHVHSDGEKNDPTS